MHCSCFPSTRYEIIRDLVVPGYESLAEAFESNYKKNLETGSQLVVFSGGVKVVDLTGRTVHKHAAKETVMLIESEKNKHSSIKKQRKPFESTYTSESIQVVHSTSKNATSLVVAWLVQQGKLDYQAPICHYWPEFGQNGKEEIKLADLLKHQGGLSFFEDSEFDFKPSDFDDLDVAAEKLAAARLTWDFKAELQPRDRLYHALTRGLYLNEIVRRVDESHRTIGQILRDFCEIDEMKQVDAVMAMKITTPKERDRLQHFKFQSILKEIHFTIVPELIADVQKINLKNFKRVKKQVKSTKTKDKLYKSFHNAQDRADTAYQRKSRKMTRKHSSQASSSPNGATKPRFRLGDNIKKTQQYYLFRSISAVEGNLFISYDEKYAYEFPSANLCTSARSLATFANLCLFANSPNRILNQETVTKMLANPEEKFDKTIDMVTTFGDGGFCHFKDGFKKIPNIGGFIGWDGFGGSILAFEPERELVVCYIPLGYRLTSEINLSKKRITPIFEALAQLSTSNLHFTNSQFFV